MKRSLSVGVAAGGLGVVGAVVVNEDVPVGPGEDSAWEVQADRLKQIIASRYERDLILESMFRFSIRFYIILVQRYWIVNKLDRVQTVNEGLPHFVRNDKSK